MDKIVKGALILTKDMDEMIHFYCNGLGIPILYKGDGDFLSVKIGYSSHGEVIELYRSDSSIESNEEISLWVEQGEEFYEDLSIKGISLSMTQEGSERTIYVLDPLGNKVIIKSNK